jgi:hypothetical protein
MLAFKLLIHLCSERVISRAYESSHYTAVRCISYRTALTFSALPKSLS